MTQISNFSVIYFWDEVLKKSKESFRNVEPSDPPRKHKTFESWMLEKSIKLIDVRSCEDVGNFFSL